MYYICFSIIILLLDIYFRNHNFNNIKYKLLGISLNINTTNNENMVFGLHKNHKSIQEIIIFISFTINIIYYLISYDNYLLIIILGGFINILEKLFKGFIVDYITIQIYSQRRICGFSSYNLKTYNFNLADTLICMNYGLFFINNLRKKCYLLNK